MEFEFKFYDVGINDILAFYKNSKGYVKINNGSHRGGKFIPSDKLENPLNVMDSNINLGMSLGEFISPKKGGSLSNLASINMFAIDIDFDFPGMTPEQVIKQLYSDMSHGYTDCSYIPFPTFIEYGHRVRFLYALKKPYILRNIKGRKNRTLKFLQKVTGLYADYINTLNPNYHAEGQKLHTTFRPAGSVNRKSVFNPATEQLETLYSIPVHIIKGNGVPMDMQDYADFVMPDRKDYEDYECRKEAKKKKRAKIHVSGVKRGNSYLVRRVETLKRLQKESNCIGMRETMCFNFCNARISLGDSKEEAYRAMSDFNSDFQIPLSPSKVRSARTKKVYKMTERTFYAQFNLEPEHTKDAEYSREYSRAYRIEKKRILTEKGKTFQQQREKKKARAKELRSLGLSADEIAIELGVSKRSVYYYLKEEPKNDVPVAKPVPKTDTDTVVSNLLDSLSHSDNEQVQSVNLNTNNSFEWNGSFRTVPGSEPKVDSIEKPKDECFASDPLEPIVHSTNLNTSLSWKECFLELAGDTDFIESG